MDSKPPNGGAPLPPIHEQSEDKDPYTKEDDSAKGKSGIRAVTKTRTETPAQDIPGVDQGKVVRRTHSKRHQSRPTTSFFEGVSPFGSEQFPSQPRSFEDSPSSPLRSRGKTISSRHSSEIDDLLTGLDEDSRKALADMRQTNMTFQEFAVALANANEDTEDANPDDVTIPEAAHHQIIDHCDLTSPNSILGKCLSHYHLQISDLPDYETERLSHLASRHLAQLPATYLGDTDLIEQSLTAIPAQYTSCFQQLLPETSAAISEVMQDLTIPCEASFKAAIKKSGKKPENTPFIELTFLLQSTLMVLNTSCYHQLVKNGYKYEVVIHEADRLIKAWQELGGKIPDKPEKLMAGLKADRTKAIAALQRYLEMLQTVAENDFRSTDNFMRSVYLINAAALNLIQTAEVEQPDSSDTYAKLRAHIAELSQLAVEHPPREHMVDCLRGYESRIKTALAKAHIKGYDKALAHILQTSCARAYTKKLVLNNNGQLRKATVEYTPAACVRVAPAEEDILEELVVETAGTHDPFKNPHNGKFCPSVKRSEANHCVNLMLVTVTLDDESPASACIYKEIRVGVPYPFAVRDSLKKNTEEVRWDEILTAALIQNQPQDLQAAMNNPDHEPVELPVMYNCLLSPDKGRPLVQRLPSMDPEIIWCRRTREKIQQINLDGVRKLTIRDSNGIKHQVQVKPKVKMAINPCNEMAFSPAFSRTGTWPSADEVTAGLLTEWLGPLESKSEPSGEAGQFLRRTDIDPLIQQQVRELALEIRQLFVTHQHRKLSLQPFLFSNMISELGRLLGYANVTGCKSAKDRTGGKSETDIRFAFDCFSARQENQSGPIKTTIIPYPWMPLTDADHFNALQCNLNSGQEENCQNNTGIPGRKVPKYMLGPAQENHDIIHRKRLGGGDKDWLKSVPPL